MREIKFRGKRVDNGEWVFGSFVPVALEGSNGDLISCGFIRRHNRGIGKMETIEVDRETVGQFTGLHDKNGKEIYEGDVLRFNGEYPMNLDSWMGRRFWEKTGYVYYDDKESRFTCTEMGNQVSTSYWIACSKEVIGNIYEHPELL